MNTLIIDTSTSLSILVLAHNNKTFSIIENAGTSHSTTMFSSISKLFAISGASINDVDLIATGIGPGSFTGIRIAVSTARMFAQLLKTPLIGIQSHDFFASSCRSENFSHKLIAFDAKKNRVYGALYSTGPEFPETIIQAGDYKISEITDHIQKGAHIQLIGDGCNRYLDELTVQINNKGSSCEYTEDFMPSEEYISKLVQKKYRKNPELYSDYALTVPDYARKSDAETALNYKKKEY